MPYPYSFASVQLRDGPLENLWRGGGLRYVATLCSHGTKADTLTEKKIVSCAGMDFRLKDGVVFGQCPMFI